MKKAILFAIVAPWLAACGAEDLGNPDFAALRGGKSDHAVDTSLSCQGQCGGLASTNEAYCGCDDACASYGDCCADKVSVCDGAPAAAIAITKADDGTTKKIALGDTIDVQLPGNPTTGYAWHLLASSRSFPLQSEQYVPDQPQLMGSGGTYHFYFTADTFSVGHQFPLSFAYYRSWEGASAAIEKFSVRIVVLPSEAQCQAIETAYLAKLGKSRGCTADAQCGFITGSLRCGHPLQSYNTAKAAVVKAFEAQWQATQCDQVPWLCPMLAPLPPWMETHAVCEQGTCQVKYVDTRAAAEGDACGEDIGVACGDGLYCAFGLNWCGTPPVTGVCRKMGDCGAESDCLNGENSWIHPMCMGQATCTAGKCGWDCSAQPM